MNRNCLKRVSSLVFICTLTGAIVYASMIDHHDHSPHSEHAITITQTTSTASVSVGTSTTTTL